MLTQEIIIKTKKNNCPSLDILVISKLPISRSKSTSFCLPCLTKRIVLDSFVIRLIF